MNVRWFEIIRDAMGSVEYDICMYHMNLTNARLTSVGLTNVGPNHHIVEQCKMETADYWNIPVADFKVMYDNFYAIFQHVVETPAEFIDEKYKD